MGRGSELKYLPGFVTSRRQPRPQRKDPNPGLQDRKDSASSRGSAGHGKRLTEEEVQEEEERRMLERRKEREREEERYRREEDRRLRKKKEEEEETMRRLEEQQKLQKERAAEEQKRMNEQKAREGKRKQKLAGIFAVEDKEEDGGSDDDRNVQQAKRNATPLPGPVSLTNVSSSSKSKEGSRLPNYGSQITDAFCNPAVASSVDPGVIADHAMRFMALKRRFRSREMGGPVPGSRRSISRSRSRSRRRRR
eukprot:gnl/MRDRNA2_/MRDRNA2_101170_c0_seq1.p1 gnl/MRDRNA2_/MRDRNA2_101170_c0~~gnl/MRDRNA2_/MRDRNA2_101170_c0_seq1.p1  ORF type:complete len:251 (-),score=65.43 gnl/MRDRNA2_/MRDRNA2_101170_c0_seq1:23-775(-)